MGVFFEEGEAKAAGLDDAVAGTVLEVVDFVVVFLPSPSLLLVPFLVVLLDCIGTSRFLQKRLFMLEIRITFGGHVPPNF